ncbi:Peptidase S41 [Moelleriella libera RCEF 2490]|uniref:Peptidase S41 n=1 Tax=Moelleriella libera RCEF 2490 TaxID=1081109 RepID=A0A167WF96_9HYPO|nr:Peptidase S41 [Moelleriella libera RCEF 2490]
MKTLYWHLLLAAAPGLFARSSDYDPLKACEYVEAALRAGTRADLEIDSIDIDGQHAQDCLLSLPFDASRAKEFVKQSRKYLQYHSTLEILKDPPKSYQSTAIDILAGLDKIESTLFKSQYEFDSAISNLTNSANDGHLVLSLCSLNIFRFFLEPMPLVSVSEDGVRIPEIYFLSDAQLLQTQKSSVSPVELINGRNALAYLQDIANQRRSQDPDARWNQLFASKASTINDASDGGGAFVDNFSAWPGTNSTTVQFSNGSRVEIRTWAKLSQLTFQSSPQDLFNISCLPERKRQNEPRGWASEEWEDDIRPPATASPQGYPKSFDRDPYNQVLGFELDKETAVMLIPSFETSGPLIPDNQSAVFAEKATSIVNEAVSLGHAKLIIDVSGNGGGNIVRAFDLFKLFFPNKFPYSATRFRRHTAINLAAKALGSLNASAAAYQGGIGYRAQVKPDQEGDFASLSDFLGNDTQYGTRVSSLFANFNYTTLSGVGEPIRGFGTQVRKLNQTQPFKPENIIIIGDGHCASTCTTFVNLMTNIGGVRTVAFGGRPRKGPMQIMGGVRGAQSASFDLIAENVRDVYQLLQESGGKLLSKEEQRLANDTMPLPIRGFPLKLLGGNVNFRNAYQQNDTELPLQFEYQAADCRLFYTLRNIFDPASTWTDAKKAIWGGAKCVDDSTGAKGSRVYQDKLENSGSSGRSGSGSRVEGADSSATQRSVCGLFLGLALVTTVAFS